MLLNIRVLPRSSKRQILGVQSDGAIKVKLTTAPVDNEANQELIALFAKELGVSKSQVTIVKGFKGRDKVLEIEGICSTKFKPI